VYDPLSVADLVHDEVRQRIESGYDISSVEADLAATLPRHFIEPLEDRTRSAVFGYDNSRISELASRTTALAEAGLESSRHRHDSRVP
jgi:hypothetical protein